MKRLILHTTWNLSPMYESDRDPKMIEDRKVIEAECEKFVKKWKGRDDYLTKVDALKEALDDYERWNRYFDGGGSEWYYFHLRNDQDEADPKLRASYNKVQHFKQNIDNSLRFFPLSLSKISAEVQTKFLNNPKLAEYKHYLEVIFAEAKYLLSEAEEKIMSMKSNSSYGNWVRMTSSFLSKEERELILEDGKREPRSFSDIMSLVDSTDKKVRDHATEKLNEILEKHVDVAVEELNAILEHKKVDDELRGFKRPDEARHISDDIDTEIVDTLIESVSRRNDVANRYYELKARLFGQKTLKYHERNVPYGDTSKNYTFEEAVNLVSHVFGNLDQEFSSILERFIVNGQIDVYPKKGKRGGAYCTFHSPVLPTYILLNYAGKLDDVLTIAHEMGHAINDELMKMQQNALLLGTPLSTAEVASTFMEDFVLEEIVAKADDQLRLEIMMMKLNSDISTIFRQVACYRFEQRLHRAYREQGFLSKDDIGELFQRTMKEYMGDAVEQSPGSKNWWIYWAHIRYFFYVYSYASGLLISKSLQRMVKKDPKTIDKVKEFLSAGMSDSPRNIFLRTGIDIGEKTFWNNGIKQIEQLLNDTEALAKKLGKI